MAALLTLFVLHLQLGGVANRRLWITLVKVVVAGAAVAGVSWAVGELIGWDTTAAAFASAIVGALVGGAVYLGGLALLHVDELSSIAALLPARLRPGGVDRGSRV